MDYDIKHRAPAGSRYGDKERHSALEALYDRGAHLFVFDKKVSPDDPVKKEYIFTPGWPENRSPLEDVLKSRHVGLIAGSLGLTVVDVDVKDVEVSLRNEAGLARIDNVMAWSGHTPCVIRSASGGGHLFYRTDDPSRGKKYAHGVLDGALEVFGATGFVEVYDPVDLLRHLDSLPVFAGAIKTEDEAASKPQDISDYAFTHRGLRLKTWDEAESWIRHQAEIGAGRHLAIFRAAMSLINTGAFTRDTQDDLTAHICAVLQDLRAGEGRDCAKEARVEVENAFKRVEASPSTAFNGSNHPEGKVGPFPTTYAGFKMAMEAMGVEIVFDNRAQRLKARGEPLLVPDGAHVDIYGYSPLDGPMSAWIQVSLLPERVTTISKENEVPFNIPDNKMNRWLEALSGEKAYDPFQQWLLDLPPWDGVRRLDTWMSVLFDLAENDQGIIRWCSRAPLLTAVARAFQPAYKMDETVVLYGPQKVGKSAIFSLLLPPAARGDWFTENLKITMDPRVRVEQSLGKVFVELSEGAGTTRRDRDDVKSYMSSTHDDIALKWDRTPRSLPRRFSFVMTTNEEQMLPNDPSGNRRYVVLRIRGRGKVGLEGYANSIREQLWAEALHEWRSGARPNLPDDLTEKQSQDNRKHEQVDEGMDEGLANAFPIPPAYPGLRLAVIAERMSLISFRREVSRMKKAQMTVLKETLLRAGWKKTESKQRGPTCDPMVADRWYAPEGGADPDTLGIPVE